MLLMTFPNHSLISRLPAASLAAAGGAVVGLSLVCVLVPIRWDDQSFAFYVAPRLLDGYRLYSPDIMELQPPLIFWLTMMPALLARSINITTQTAYVFCLAALVCACVLWSVGLSVASRRVPRRLFQAGLAILLMYVLFLLPSLYWRGGGGIRYDFGQREHLMTVLVLPYLFSVARRIESREMGRLEAVLAGLAAALGFSLKPQYIFIAACVEAIAVIKTSGLRNLVRPELLALLSGGLLYGLSIWLFTPEYLTVAAPFFAQAYGDFAYKTLAELIYQPTTFAMGAIAAALIWRGRDETQALIFLLGSIGAFVAFVLQHKGWSDHLLPAQILLVLSLGILAINQLLTWSARQTLAPPLRRAVAVAIAAITCIAAVGIYYPVRADMSARGERERWIAEINDETQGFRPGTAFVALTDGIDVQFNLANDRAFVWASRYPCLVLPAATLERVNSPGGQSDAARGYQILGNVLKKFQGKLSGASDESAYVRKVREDVVEDFRRWKPDIVLVRRCEIDTEPCIFGANFDVIGWLSSEQDFSSLWSGYRFFKRLGKYDLYYFVR